MKFTSLSLLIILIFSFTAAGQNADSVNYYMAAGGQAYSQKDFSGFKSNMLNAYRLLPSNSTVRYNMACAYALTKEYGEAARLLADMAEKGIPIAANALKDTDFSDLWNEYGGLKEKLAKLAEPLLNSRLHVIINEKDLIPEGITIDSRNGNIYLSSLYKSKIVKIDSEGNISDFVKEGEYGLAPTVGMKADEKREILWVCSGVHDYHNRLDSSMIGMSGLFAFNLNTGKLVNKYILPQEGHFLNDLDVAADGTVYLTDSKHRQIYQLRAGSDKLEKYIDIPQNFYPNGIALSENGRLLYVAGPIINVIDLRTKEIKNLNAPENIILSGDGLYLYRNSLIAVQNTDLNRITRLYLDASGYSVDSAEVMEYNNPEWNIPTTGSIYKDKFYYIGNSQLRFLRPGSPVKPEDLKPVQIRVIAD